MGPPSARAAEPAVCGLCFFFVLVEHGEVGVDLRLALALFGVAWT